MRPGAAGGAVWLGSGGPAAPGQNPVPGPARGERPPPNPLAGMEEPGMDTEAETVATEGPARPLSCLEAEAAAGAAAEDSCAARGTLQPAPAQPPGDLAAQASVSNGEDAGGGAGRELVDLKIDLLLSTGLCFHQQHKILEPHYRHKLGTWVTKITQVMFKSCS